MTRLDPSHPRFASLKSRARLAAASRRGLVVPEGLIAHGRGEAFDYYLGERTIPSARAAERTAAAWLWTAERPVLSVNGNVAALAAREVAELARTLPRLAVEVNLFHRTPRRVGLVLRALEAAGVARPLGLAPTGRIAGLRSDRARVDRQGIGRADVCLIPLEDGDRALALRRAGTRVISIDLNPLSRTSTTADLPIVDELTRALPAIAAELRRLSRLRRPPRTRPRFDAAAALASARRRMADRLTPVRSRRPRGRAPGGRRPARGTPRRSHRTR
ncbi:MAG TPA: phosphopantothenate/pantothenate synthetase [Thermoplasmata archaeon]|nr:phosphopantothenate/pantothenate synthetase [Thermoplasmata archaeon]